MIKIAICDDDYECRDKLEKCLSKIEETNNYDFEITTFSSGEAICESIKNQNFDLIFFDIIMGGMTGIEAAKIVKQQIKNCYFAFVSSYDNDLRALFGINTIAFIDKPFEDSQIEKVVDNVIEHIVYNNKKIFTYKIKGIEHFIQINDIIAFESTGYQIEIYTKNENILFNDSLKNIWSILQSNNEFVMPHKSYIVNMKNCIMKSTKVIKAVTINKTIEIPIGRIYKEATLQRYMKILKEGKL